MRAFLMLLLFAGPAIAQDWTQQIWRQVQEIQRSQSRAANTLAELKFAQEQRIVGVERMVYESQQRVAEIEDALARKNIDVANTSAKWWDVTSWVINALFGALLLIFGAKLHDLRKREKLHHG